MRPTMEERIKELLSEKLVCKIGFEGVDVLVEMASIIKEEILKSIE